MGGLFSKSNLSDEQEEKEKSKTEDKSKQPRTVLPSCRRRLDDMESKYQTCEQENNTLKHRINEQQEQNTPDVDRRIQQLQQELGAVRQQLSRCQQGQQNYGGGGRQGPPFPFGR